MTDAKQDWDSRIGNRTGVSFAGNAPELEPPDGVVAVAGGYQVTLDWKPVDGAVGYQVHVAESADGPWSELDHPGRDVLAVPHPPYVDTTGTQGEERWYAVASLSDVHVEGPLSAPVSALSLIHI